MKKNELAHTLLETKLIPVDEIMEPKFIDRSEKDEEKLLTLMNSIKNGGLLNPIWVRVVKGKYERIAGSRRIEAHKRLKINEINAMVFKASEEAAYRMAWLENNEREKLPPVDEIKAILNLVQLRRNAKLKQRGEKIEHVEPIYTFASNVYKVYTSQIHDKSTNKIEESPEFSVLLSALNETCEREGINMSYFVSKLKLVSLPTRLLAEVNKGNVAINSAFEALKWRDRLLGKPNGDGEYSEDGQKAFEKLVRFIIETRPKKPEVKAYAEELLALEKSKLGIEKDYRAYMNTLSDIEFDTLNNQQKIKLVGLMKKINTIVKPKKRGRKKI